MIQEQGTISIHTENIFPIIKKFLYSDNEIFLRELVSNAVDATQKIKRLASLGEFNGELGELDIQVSVDKEAKTITISDKGIGMTAEEIKKYINQVAFSGATEFIEKYKDAKDAQDIIGKFGLGFYSAFMVADTVEINSLSYQDEQAAHWTCDGSTTYAINEGTKTERGTDIILHINEESEEFLDEHRIEEILRKYGQFLPVPIQFGTKTNHEPDGEDEEGNPKYKEVEVPNIINNTHPLWVKSPSELTDEDYLNFYRELYPMSEEPLFWIHLNVDYPFELTGILYFPKVQNEFELQKNKIKLFSRQVFITDEVNEIVPEFLMLLHGVIDSPDIPLNVSRSFLQADGNVKKINSYITRKVADKLSEIYKEDRKSYEEKWADIGLFVKYGMLSEERFYDKATAFCLLESTEGKFYTLEEYKTKVAPLQTDKNDQLIYLYATDKEKQYQYIKAAEEKNYDVLLMNSPIDQHFIGFIETKLEKTSLKRVDADLVQNLIEKDEKIESVLTEEQEKQVVEAYTNVINNKNMEVSVSAQNPDDAPVTITMDEFMRRMKDMAKMGGGGMMNMYGTLPDSYKVNINGNHPLMQEILAAEDAEKEAVIKQSYDLALLAQNMLNGEALNTFIKRSIDLMKK